MSQLRVSEIFYSLQGESNLVGLPTLFVRLTGCPLRCLYCDTTYAFKGGEWMTLSDILERVAAHRPARVMVTGGEPLAQNGCLELLSVLCDAGYQVALETSGSFDISGVDSRVVTIMDLKTPGSGEAGRNLYTNIGHLKLEDQVKFVIRDAADYEWAKRLLDEWSLNDRCEVLFSPAYGEQGATELAGWILRDRLPVRFQIQLHKYLWGDLPGR